MMKPVKTVKADVPQGEMNDSILDYFNDRPVKQTK